jgi:hypothetical protein
MSTSSPFCYQLDLELHERLCDGLLACGGTLEVLTEYLVDNKHGACGCAWAASDLTQRMLNELWGALSSLKKKKLESGRKDDGLHRKIQILQEALADKERLIVKQSRMLDECTRAMGEQCRERLGADEAERGGHVH